MAGTTDDLHPSSTLTTSSSTMAAPASRALRRCICTAKQTAYVRPTIGATQQRIQRRWQSDAAASTNPKISTIVDQISQLTLLETADLVSTLKVRTPRTWEGWAAIRRCSAELWWHATHDKMACDISRGTVVLQSSLERKRRAAVPKLCQVRLPDRHIFNHPNCSPAHLRHSEFLSLH
jgi:hypothetical protein